ncbi:hypothetical protein WN943_005370 [Citrus x changshan-huyou]
MLVEPTSGLDSTTAQRILTTIKRLANSSRTIITTIHQPSSRLYHVFDKVVLLSGGSPIYNGPASTTLEYFSSIGFSTIHLQIVLKLQPDYKQSTDQGENTDQDQKLAREALKSAYEKNIATKLKDELSNLGANDCKLIIKDSYSTFILFIFL